MEKLETKASFDIKDENSNSQTKCLKFKKSVIF